MIKLKTKVLPAEGMRYTGSNGKEMMDAFPNLVVTQFPNQILTGNEILLLLPPKNIKVPVMPIQPGNWVVKDDKGFYCVFDHGYVCNYYEEDQTIELEKPETIN